jgi:hypothetical protein
MYIGAEPSSRSASNVTWNFSCVTISKDVGGDFGWRKWHIYRVLGILELAVEISGSRGEDDSVCANRGTEGRDEDVDIRAYRMVQESARGRCWHRFALREVYLWSLLLESNDFTGGAADGLVIERHGV